jgi:hypothetical protein
MGTKGLIPDDLGDFRSSTFWQGFFKARGDRPFEWYGSARAPAVGFSMTDCCVDSGKSCMG